MVDFNVIPLLNTERLILKPLSLDHCTDLYVSWMNDPIVIMYLESGGNYTLKMLEEYIISIISKKIFFWAIHLKTNEKHIGNIKIDPINIRHSYGEYGILMGDKDEWGKGFANEASSVVLDFCFNILELRKVNLGVVAANKPAVNLYKKMGFIQEGLYQKHGYYNGEYLDILRMTYFNQNIGK